MQKTIFIPSLTLLLMLSTQTLAQTDVDILLQENPAKEHSSEDFMLQYFEDMDQVAAENEAAKAAQNAATELIATEPTMVSLPKEELEKLKVNEILRQQRVLQRQQSQQEATAEGLLQEPAEGERQAETPAEPSVKASVEEAENSEEKLDEKAENMPEKAPFGLYWGMSKEEAENAGFELKEAELEGYNNAYAVINPKQNSANFELVIAVFSEQNHLDTIYAQSALIEDTPQAEKVLALYDRYYAALKQKYGNDKEYFTPNTYEEEVDLPQGFKQSVQSDGNNEKPEPVKVVKKSPRGNEHFLQELQERKASLFATFGDKKIKVTLLVEVTEQMQSRIVLNYENLGIREKDSAAVLNDLMDDL